MLVSPGCEIPRGAGSILDVSVDDWFDYEALTEYYGPSSVIEVLRFNQLVREALGRATHRASLVRVIAHQDNPKRTNAAFLVGAYLVLEAGMRADLACQLLGRVSCGVPSYRTQGMEIMLDHLEISHVLRGLETFRDLGLLDLASIDPEETAFYEDPDNGDMNWIVKDQLLAFAGPDDEGLGEFIRFAQAHNITGVVRLNEGEYDASSLEAAHIAHLDLQVVDGSIPQLDQIRAFYRFADRIIGSGAGLAVHCRAGLGRTGTMIGAYLIRKHRLDALQTIGFMRVMRPGMFLARQPRFMEAIQYWLRDEKPTKEQATFIESVLGARLHEQLRRNF